MLKKIVVGLLSILWMYIEDFWKPVIGWIFVSVGLVALAVVFPYILILYALGIGGALLRK